MLIKAKVASIRLIMLNSLLSLMVACGGQSDDSENAESSEEKNIENTAQNSICVEEGDAVSLCPRYSEQLLSTISNHNYLTDEYQKVNAKAYLSDVAIGNFIEVYVNQNSAEDFSAIDPDVNQSGVEVAAGTSIIREVWHSDGSSIKQYTAMVKMERGYFPGGGDFAYAVVDVNGEVVRGGKLQDCAICHKTREFDGYLFGVPELEKQSPEDTPLDTSSLDSKYTEMAKTVIQTQSYLNAERFQKVNDAPYPSALNAANHLDVYVSQTGAFSYLAVDPNEGQGPAVQIPEETVIVRQVLDAETGRSKSFTIMVKGPIGYFPEGGDFYYGVFDVAGNPESENGVAMQGKLENCGGCHLVNRQQTGFVFGVPEAAR